MRKLFTILFISIVFISCEDVIELDLDNAEPRLVIDAAIELQEDGTTTASVLLTRSAAFYQEEINYVDNATITITDQNGIAYPFTFISNGLYTNTTMSVQDGDVYTLDIIDGTDTYTATQEYINTVPYTRVEQESIDGFGDFTQITGYFNDPIGEGDYYLVEYEDEFNTEIDISDDEFSDGNESLTAFFMEDLPVGTDIILRIKGIDLSAYNFYSTLIQQTADAGGGPFDTQPATVRGNIVNTTNSENFPYGYFRVSQVYDIEYTTVAD